MKQTTQLTTRLGKHNKVKCNNHSTDIYKYYKKQHGNVVPGLTKSVFTKICKEFNGWVVHNITHDSGTFYIPNLGSLSIKKRLAKAYLLPDGKLITKHLPVDYKSTLELWQRDLDAKEQKKLIRHINKHSDGFKAKFYWEKLNINIRNSHAYVFKPTRIASRILAEVMLNPDIETNYEQYEFRILHKRKHNNRKSV
jgi:hypothetical protein